jgi:hypothetical protein
MTAKRTAPAKTAAKRSKRARRFSTVATTQATAETPAPAPAAEPKAKAAPAAPAEPAAEKRSAYTWRLTAREALQLDSLVLELRSELGRGHLSRADVLGALVKIAASDKAVRTQLVERIAAG